MPPIAPSRLKADGIILFNFQGSTKTTRYIWNFGDGSQGLNVTGLSKAKRVSHVFQQHGDFVVTVAATNKAGMSAVTVGVTALGNVTPHGLHLLCLCL